MERLDLFYEFIKKTLTFNNPRDAINDILKNFCDIFNFDSAIIFLLNDRATFFYAGYFYGVPSDRIDGVRIPATINSFFKMALEENRIIIKDRPINAGIFAYDFGIIEQIMPRFCIFPIKESIEGNEQDTFYGVIVGGYGKKAEKIDRELIVQIGNILSEYIGRLLRNAVMLKETYEKSIRDPLTGLYNRTFFLEMLTKEIERVKRYNTKCALAMIDIDFFKEVNDRFGHLVGDMALGQLADFLISNVRTLDTVARYGGEEFILLLPEVDRGKTQLILERIRKGIEDKVFYRDMRITISIGAVEITAELLEKETRLDSLIDMADKALYRAKESGRNRVLFYEVV